MIARENLKNLSFVFLPDVTRASYPHGLGGGSGPLQVLGVGWGPSQGSCAESLVERVMSHDGATTAAPAKETGVWQWRGAAQDLEGHGAALADPPLRLQAGLASWARDWYSNDTGPLTQGPCAPLGFNALGLWS